MSRVNDRAALVSKAQRAFRQGGDTRMLKREAQAGNRYVLAKLDRLGLVYDRSMGAIRRLDDK